MLDAASTAVQVGLLAPGRAPVWQRPAGDAGTALFAGAEAALAAAGQALAGVGAFVFCEGPGSLLGTRTAAMALRTWQALQPRPVYAYQSLALAARDEWARQPPRSFAVIADARRDAWHVQLVEESGGLPALRRLPTTELPAGELFTPENFRAWSAAPRPLATCRYDLAAIFPALGETDLFRPVDAPAAFEHDAPEYRKWSAQVHSRATAPRR